MSRFKRKVEKTLPRYQENSFRLATVHRSTVYCWLKLLGRIQRLFVELKWFLFSFSRSYPQKELRDFTTTTLLSPLFPFLNHYF